MHQREREPRQRTSESARRSSPGLARVLQLDQVGFSAERAAVGHLVFFHLLLFLSHVEKRRRSDLFLSLARRRGVSPIESIADGEGPLPSQQQLLTSMLYRTKVRRMNLGLKRSEAEKNCDAAKANKRAEMTRRTPGCVRERVRWSRAKLEHL